MTSRVEQALKHGQMGLVMRDSIKMDPSMDLVNLHGLMEPHSWVISRTIISMGLAGTLGQMDASIVGNGSMIRCTELEFSNGAMEEPT